MNAIAITDDIARLTRERDEARAYLKAFVYATIDLGDRRADVQVHQANPSLGWYFTLNDTGMRGHRQILGSQIRRAMEIVGFDRLKIDAPETTVADDHVSACRRASGLKAGGAAQTEIITKAQAILTSYLTPDGIGGAEAINRLLGLLDGPEQRAAQALWDAAVAKAEARS